MTIIRYENYMKIKLTSYYENMFDEQLFVQVHAPYNRQRSKIEFINLKLFKGFLWLVFMI